MVEGTSEKGVLRPIQLGADDRRKLCASMVLLLYLWLCCCFVLPFPSCQTDRNDDEAWRPRFSALAHLTTLSTRYLAALRLTHSHSQSHSRSYSPSLSDSVCDSYFNYFLCDFCFCYSAARHIPICVFIFTFIPIQCLSFLLLLLLFCFGCRDSVFEITNAPSGTG